MYWCKDTKHHRPSTRAMWLFFSMLLRTAFWYVSHVRVCVCVCVCVFVSQQARSIIIQRKKKCSGSIFTICLCVKQPTWRQFGDWKSKDNAVVELHGNQARGSSLLARRQRFLVVICLCRSYPAAKLQGVMMRLISAIQSPISSRPAVCTYTVKQERSQENEARL